jgi:hypothetical protein
MQIHQDNSYRIYHQIAADGWAHVKKEGLKSNSRGAHGDDQLLVKTDTFLDDQLPQKLKDAGVSRKNNSYGYLGNTKAVIDILTGTSVSVSEKNAEDLILLQLDVNNERCWVSNLDLYDEVKRALDRGVDVKQAARRYWQALTRLDQYRGSIVRPEVMITYDIPPINISEIHT